MNGMDPFIEFVGESMKNPFANDLNFKNLTDKADCKYVVVHYNWDSDKDKDSFEVIKCVNYGIAFKTAVQISEGGLWAYVIDITNDDVLMYLTGMCTLKK